MSLLAVIAILITLTAVFSFINERYIGLPITIGVMAISLVASLALVLFGPAFPPLVDGARHLLDSIEFDTTVLQGMLSFLLFAGALHVNLNDLLEQKVVIAVLATVGVIASTFIIGFATFYILGFLGLSIPFIYCLLFGSLISPTDPIAVLGILKSAGVPKSLEMKIVGESLFNDGVGYVVFVIILGIAAGSFEPTAGNILFLFAEEAIGGAIFGFAIGYVSYLMLKWVDNYQVEILITLALVMGGYTLAQYLHLSGPIAIVFAGLLIGNHGRLFAMSKHVRHHLDTFWELVDEILNAILFVLIGLEVLVLTIEGNYILAGIILIPVVLLIRFAVVGIPVTILRRFREFTPGAISLMTWGGLRGAISVALALMVTGEHRDMILVITYVIVVFSILVQGLTIKPLASKLIGPAARVEPDDHH